jgi:multidrug efflux system outer membrane protein
VKPAGTGGGRFRPAPVLALATLLAACSAGQDYTPPSMDLGAGFAHAPGGQSPAFQTDPWWEAFRDPVLNRLVGEGMVQNLTLRQAMERVTAAEATAGAAGLTGTMDAELSSAVENDFAGNETRSRSGVLNISWIADFFGQYKRAGESAEARLDEAFANVEVARLVYLSDLVTAYIDARYYQERLALKRQDLRARELTLRATRDLLDAGSATGLSVAQAEGLVAESRADIPLLENGFHLAVNRIATLVGRPSSTLIAELSQGAPQPVPHRRVSTGIPADLIRNRPDIRAAERRLAAAVAEAGIAEAQLYPSVALTGVIQGQNVGGSDSRSWSFGPVIDIPLFDMGQRQARVSIAESGARSRYLEWQETVLNAVEEVENALSSVSRNGRAAASSREVVDSYEKAVDLARVSYENRQVTLLEVLEVQRSLENARGTWSGNLRQQALDFVALNVALGGGARPPVEALSASAPTAPVAAVAAETPEGVPAGDPALAAAPAGSWTVQPGETLYRIALNHGVSVEALGAANGIGEPWTVHVGQVLTIPAG